MMRRDKLVVIGLLGLMVVTSVGAILFDRPVAPLPAFGGTYVEGVVGAPQNLNPLIAATNVDRDVARLVFSGLTRYDREGAVVPDLAASFRSEADGRVWTFDLRADAYWHDGAPFVADDVVYTVSLLQDRAYAGPYGDAFRGVAVERVGARAVRFTLPEPYGPFAGSTTVPLLPAHLLEGVAFADLAAHPSNLRPIGTGPFRVSEVDARQILLTRHENFHGIRPERSRAYLDQVIIRFYRDTADSLAALARREVDGVGGLARGEAERARSLKTATLYSLPTSDFTALFLNVRPDKTLFRDRSVRQALAVAIDRGRVLTAGADGRGIVAESFVPPTSWAFAKDVQRYTHSATEAKALLESAGWLDADGDGVREKDGLQLRFTLTTPDEPALVAAAQEVAQDLDAVGARVTIRSVPFADLVDRIARQRAFDMLLVTITSGTEPDPYAFFHSSQVGDPGFNFSGYSTLPLDRSLESARRTADSEERRELYATVFRQISLEVPVIFLYFSDYLYAHDRVVNGFLVAPISDPTERFWNVADWFVRTLPGR
ncbi:MAG: peptide ABC transporter substrate-binding protein [Candidatus Limnocylindria bacterium]